MARSDRQSTFGPLRERLVAHTDAERDMARRRLRVAQAAFTAASDPYWQAIRERQAAAAHANDVGVEQTEIARVFGLRDHSAVSRMIARFRGEATTAAENRRKRRAERVAR